MKFRISVFLLLLLPLCFIKAEEKNIRKNFKVNPYQRVFINGVSSLQLKITGWDKNEAEVNIRVKASSSDTQFGKEYLQNFDVINKTDGNDIIIDFIETSKQGSWSVLDIFKGDFKYSFSKEISGEIFLPRSVLLNGDFKYSDITVAGIAETVNLKGKGNHFAVKDCRKINEIFNEYGDVAVAASSGKLNADLKLSPLTIEDFNGQAKIKCYGASVKVNMLTGGLYMETYNSKCSVENVSGRVTSNSEIGDLTFRKIEKDLEIYDKAGVVAVYDINGFKMDGARSALIADRINSKEKIFITTKYGTYKISNSSGSYFIDDDYSKYTFTSVTGPVYYSASNSSFTGNDLKGDWKSDAKYSEINLNGISASRIEAAGRGKIFKAVIVNNPKKVEIKNEDADILLTLNKEIKTSIFLTASHGNLSSDFSIHIEKEGSVSKAAERINGGGAVISAETRNGNITVRRQ